MLFGQAEEGGGEDELVRTIVTKVSDVIKAV